ncbi:choline kinase [Eggerthia catenaformis]|nr:choline kinase [Eggerthia catenaformis]
MNKHILDVFKQIVIHKIITQRQIAVNENLSIGMVNKCIKYLRDNDFIDKYNKITAKGSHLLKVSKPKNAIILASGYGMRMVPINTEVSKGMLEIHGEPLIERLIGQLKEKGINDIYIVVGFLKEQYEYLIDKYNVYLIVNDCYSVKNNLYSLSLATTYIDHSYIIPCDMYAYENPFSEYELYSWYMVSDETKLSSDVRVNKKGEIVRIKAHERGQDMLGIAYLDKDASLAVKRKLKEYSESNEYEQDFWEKTLVNHDKYLVYAKVVDHLKYVEINTYEQLRELDENSNQLNTEAISIIKESLHAEDKDIKNITVLKKGMTNRSFLFECRDEKYIMRIPGEGTDQLINRLQEADVYHTIENKGICDNNIYLNPQNGYKITKFINHSRNCDPSNEDDVKKCMKKLKKFHDMNLQVSYYFDIFKQIDFYESLRDNQKSVYKDYLTTKEHVFELKEYIDKHVQKKCLTHIDAVCDNFMFSTDEKGHEKIDLIDWEYASMQDPHVDIAMFSIYAFYDKQQIDHLIDIYFSNQCDKTDRIKIYAYVSACGLLWSNWCEYKRNIGIDFGEYSLRQYRYAKDYYKIVKNELEKRNRI